MGGREREEIGEAYRRGGEAGEDMEGDYIRASLSLVLPLFSSPSFLAPSLCRHSTVGARINQRRSVGVAQYEQRIRVDDPHRGADQVLRDPVRGHGRPRPRG